MLEGEAASHRTPRWHEALLETAAADAPLVELANPWKSARVIQGPNESEVFRRSVMTIVTLLAFWGFAVLIAALLGVV